MHPSGTVRNPRLCGSWAGLTQCSLPAYERKLRSLRADLPLRADCFLPRSPFLVSPPRSGTRSEDAFSILTVLMARSTPNDLRKTKKLTLSCSRCRACKLKCDRKEPCLECVKRDVGYLCTKDERQPRAKRTKTQDNGQTLGQVTPAPDDEPEVEETARILEHFVDGNPPPAPDPAAVASDFPNRYWVTMDPRRHEQKLALIREVVEALPEWDVMNLLYEIFVTRCQGPLGNVVHTPTFMQQAEQFRHCLRLEAPDTAIASTMTMDSLAGLLLALLLGLAFHPTPSLLGWTLTPLTCSVEQLRASDEPAATWRTLAVRCLHGGTSLFCGSIPSLQAAVMLLLDAKDSSLALDAVLVTAISGARKLGLHRLGHITLDALPVVGDDFSATTEPPHIRTEIAIRLWWALVMRDWSRGQALGYCTICPSQFNTRMPLHINDDDLCRTHGKICERPRSEFTMLSYTVHALELASIVRESINLRDASAGAAHRRQRLNQQYEEYVAGLPLYFRLGSTVGLTAMGPMAAVPVQRFLLHHQLWSLLLRLHRANLFSPVGRAACQLLAQNIIGTQAQIQARCAVCDSLSTNDTQLFNATVVLILGLLFDSVPTESDQSSAQLSRLMTRDKIREAIELLRSRSLSEDPSQDTLPRDMAHGSALRSVMALEALMRLEEQDSADGVDSLPGHGTGSDERRSLHRQVVEILETLRGPAGSNEWPVPGLSAPGVGLPSLSLSTADDFSDLDVMPILTNSLSPSVWEFLDFPAAPDSAKKDNFFSIPGDFVTNTLNPSLGDSTTGMGRTETSPSSPESEFTSDPVQTPPSADALTAAAFYRAQSHASLSFMVTTLRL
ncbi:uncharacterized protein N7498_003516 [Penicillium cinerascens]|uniref:Zn(2)-C6 fungal-type domain-containing protein n=1 Tax=Penicillium cinerascens TaxID=70096 RepID=A0A9W9N254_9EURO|nr:uncharacterized protein N7498_003516 [Penicillium cinerascens]KAJ5211870.1 hypothetical protein N7498_003516 [Penicillium cinerascens]